MRKEEQYVNISPGDIIVTTPKSQMKNAAQEAKKRIKPILMKGFRGFRYFYRVLPGVRNVKVIGGWKDPKPEVK